MKAEPAGYNGFIDGSPAMPASALHGLLLLLLAAGFAVWTCAERLATDARFGSALRKRCVGAIAVVFAWRGIPRAVVYTGVSD